MSKAASFEYCYSVVAISVDDKLAIKARPEVAHQELPPQDASRESSTTD
jgi:hypothetical protein